MCDVTLLLSVIELEFHCFFVRKGKAIRPLLGSEELCENVFDWLTIPLSVENHFDFRLLTRLHEGLKFSEGDFN